eukprot:1161810-Pelagomonas_calceolata.AAC.12
MQMYYDTVPPTVRSVKMGIWVSVLSSAHAAATSCVCAREEPHPSNYEMMKPSAEHSVWRRNLETAWPMQQGRRPCRYATSHPTSGGPVLHKQVSFYPLNECMLVAMALTIKCACLRSALHAARERASSQWPHPPGDTRMLLMWAPSLAHALHPPNLPTCTHLGLCAIQWLRSESASYQFVTQKENKGEKLFAAYLESLRHLARYSWQDTDEARQGQWAVPRAVPRAYAGPHMAHMCMLCCLRYGLGRPSLGHAHSYKASCHALDVSTIAEPAALRALSCEAIALQGEVTWPLHSTPRLDYHPPPLPLKHTIANHHGQIASPPLAIAQAWRQWHCKDLIHVLHGSDFTTVVALPAVLFESCPCLAFVVSSSSYHRHLSHHLISPCPCCMAQVMRGVTWRQCYCAHLFHLLHGEGVIAILVVQAILVLTLLHLYQLKLVVDVERARLGNILALIGLPGPILRIMHAKPVNILDDDSDDEADEEEDGDKKLARAERKEEERRCQAELEGGGADEADGDKDDDEGDGKVGGAKAHKDHEARVASKIMTRILGRICKGCDIVEDHDKDNNHVVYKLGCDMG